MSQIRILLVDDDPGLTTLLDLIFRRAEFEVIVANGGYDGLEKAAELLPGLILLDIMMPDMNGIEVCQDLRANPLTADIPILILSASSNNSDRDLALAAGANAFIQKPVSPIELVSRVNMLISEKVSL
jgi:DNA-binding response OmpR family regulator